MLKYNENTSLTNADKIDTSILNAKEVAAYNKSNTSLNIYGTCSAETSTINVKEFTACNESSSCNIFGRSSTATSTQEKEIAACKKSTSLNIFGTCSAETSNVNVKEVTACKESSSCNIFGWRSTETSTQNAKEVTACKKSISLNIFGTCSTERSEVNVKEVTACKESSSRNIFGRRCTETSSLNTKEVTTGNESSSFNIFGRALESSTKNEGGSSGYGTLAAFGLAAVVGGGYAAYRHYNKNKNNPPVNNSFKEKEEWSESYWTPSPKGPSSPKPLKKSYPGSTFGSLEKLPEDEPYRPSSEASLRSLEEPTSLPNGSASDFPEQRRPEKCMACSYLITGGDLLLIQKIKCSKCNKSSYNVHSQCAKKTITCALCWASA